MMGTRKESRSGVERKLATMPVQIVTSSWFTKLPPTIARIGISKGSPRGQSGFRRYMALAPNFPLAVPLDEYLDRYSRQLEAVEQHHACRRSKLRGKLTVVKGSAEIGGTPSDIWAEP